MSIFGLVLLITGLCLFFWGIKMFIKKDGFECGLGIGFALSGAILGILGLVNIFLI